MKKTKYNEILKSLKNNMKKETKSFVEYLEKIKNRSKSTIENYTRSVKLLGEFIEYNMEILSEEKIEEFTIHIQKMECPRKKRQIDEQTVALHMSAIKGFIKFLGKRGKTSVKSEKIEVPTPKTKKMEVLMPKEVEDILQKIENKTIIDKRDKAIIEILYGSGLRVSEICSLKTREINFSSGEFRIIGKGNKERICFLTKKAKEAIREYILERNDIDEHLFVSHKRGSKTKGKKLSRASVEASIRIRVKNAGFERKITPHTFRHSFATTLLNRGANIREIQEFLGHSSITTTQRYTHVTNNKLREVHKMFMD